MLPGMILGAAGVIAAVLLFQIGWSARSKDYYFVRFSALGVLIAGVAVTVVMETHSSDVLSGERRLAGVPVDELARVSSSLSGSGSALAQLQPPAGKVASVPSLISGLEQRLESEPDDPRGWSLLAQSYAFLGEAEEAEQALTRAVGLGADEDDLRNRVASARRNPHAGIPGAPPLD